MTDGTMEITVQYQHLHDRAYLNGEDVEWEFGFSSLPEAFLDVKSELRRVGNMAYVLFSASVPGESGPRRYCMEVTRRKSRRAYNEFVLFGREARTWRDAGGNEHVSAGVRREEQYELRWESREVWQACKQVVVGAVHVYRKRAVYAADYDPDCDWDEPAGYELEHLGPLLPGEDCPIDDDGWEYPAEVVNGLLAGFAAINNAGGGTR